MDTPAYPQILKNTDWQKEKSIIAKVLPGKKTGIGEEMLDCEAIHKQLHEAAQHVAGLAQMTNDVKQLAVKLGMSLATLEVTANDAASKWSAKTSPVPKATRIHAENIAKAAKQYLDSIKTTFGI